MRFDLPDYVIAEIRPSGELMNSRKAGNSADGIKIPVRVDFRLWMEFECAMFSGDGERIGAAVEDLLPEDIPALEPGAILSALLDFYALRNPYPMVVGGDDSDVRRGSGKSGKSEERWYDFEEDFGRIAGSFRAAYGIDLFRDSLHWREFRVLMLHLPAECEFMRVVGYRTADLSALTKVQRKHYQKMKALYALPGLSRRFATFRERERDMLRRMELIRKEMREDVGR